MYHVFEMKNYCSEFIALLQKVNVDTRRKK